MSLSGLSHHSCRTLSQWFWVPNPGSSGTNCPVLQGQRAAPAAMGSSLGSTTGSSLPGTAAGDVGAPTWLLGNRGEGTTGLSNTFHCCANIQQSKSFVWLERHRCKLMGISNLCEQNASSSSSLDISDSSSFQKQKVSTGTNCTQAQKWLC